MKTGVLGGILLILAALLLLDDVNLMSTDQVDQALGGQDRGEEIAQRVTWKMAEAAPLVPPEKVVPCTDLGRPGSMIGRFCRHVGSQSVNLRVAQTIPVSALRQLPNLPEIEAMRAR